MKILDGVCTLLRWVTGIIFIYAGGVKLLEPRVFATLIEAYGILPDTFILPVAVFLPLLEVVGGIGIIFNIKGSLSLIAGLILLFLLILGYGITMGLDVDCGCFGSGDSESKAFHGLKAVFLRDLFMMAGVFYIFLWRRYQKNKSRELFPTTAS